MSESVTVLEVERCDMANLSSLVILIVGAEKFPMVNPLELLGLETDVEACWDISEGRTVELVVANQITVLQRIVWLITTSLKPNGVQGNIRFLGADCHKLKKEVSVVSGEIHQQIIRRATRVELT